MPWEALYKANHVAVWRQRLRQAISWKSPCRRFDSVPGHHV